MGIGEGKETIQRKNMSERRKSSKPIMEKRRRERINNSLNELKNLLLESRKKDTTCCSKLEKADILEMTVQYLKSIRSQQEKASTTTDPVALAHYRAGFNQSAMEISRFLIDTPDIEVKVRTRLLTYLSNTCHTVISNQATMKQYYPSLYPTPTYQPPEISTPTLKDTSLSTPILGDPSISSIAPHDRLPYFPNPSQLLMPTPLINGKSTPLFAHTPNLFTSLTQPQVLPGHQFKIEPTSSTTTTNHGQELSGKTTTNSSTTSPNSVITSNNLDSTSRDSFQAPVADDGSVWRPWS